MKELTKIEEILLVAIWRLKDNAYGVEIRKYVSNIIGKEFTYGHLYSALNQLVLKKYVLKSVGNVSEQRMGRPRIYYSITSIGQKALDSAIELNEKLWAGLSKYAQD
ncbi:PadR family transcriptional regulator [Acidobacteriota bacterium]